MPPYAIELADELRHDTSFAIAMPRSRAIMLAYAAALPP